ncbi:MAG TPA: 1-(5-phosphoribosyl)-5-[(5-phosphoribosylamino)methylideneamino]imidazole-4-carboxamide isomerase [Polyangiales bacterium]
MELIPAIDLLGGKVVRLQRGRYDQVTIYSERPVEQARVFYDAGARSLHVVDLDGARDGEPKNLAVIEAILRSVPMRIQVGGGIRDAQTAKRWLAAGAQRVVLGTAAVKDPQLVKTLCAEHPGSVVVAVDERDGEVAVEGWLEGSGRSARDLAREVDAWGVGAILHTVIARDGTREGPDVDATLALQSAVTATVIASGGIGELAHIRTLAERGVRAAVCGRALLSGAFSIPEAFEAAGMQR